MALRRGGGGGRAAVRPRTRTKYGGAPPDHSHLLHSHLPHSDAHTICPEARLPFTIVAAIEEATSQLAVASSVAFAVRLPTDGDCDTIVPRTPRAPPS